MDISIPKSSSLKSISQAYVRKQKESSQADGRLQDLDRLMDEVLLLDNSESDRNPLAGQIDVRAPENLKMPYFGASATTRVELETTPTSQRLSHYSIDAPVDISTTSEPEPESDYVVGVSNVYVLSNESGLISHSRASFEHELKREFEEVWDPTFGYNQEFEKDPGVAIEPRAKIDEENFVIDPKSGTIASFS